MLSYDQISEIEKNLGPQAPAVISALQSLDRRIEEQRLELKKDLLVELATKADIERLEGLIKADGERLEGRIKADGERLEGRINTLEADLRGELKSIQLWMKTLVALALIGMAFFSPAGVELIRMFK